MTPFASRKEPSAEARDGSGSTFRALDLGRVKGLLRTPLVIDLRNIYQPQEMQEAGLGYVSIGRPGSPPPPARAELRAVTG